MIYYILLAFIQALFSTAVFFQRLGFLYCFAELVGHQGRNFLNLDPQTIGKCISDSLFDFKSQCLSLINIISPANIITQIDA